MPDRTSLTFTRSLLVAWLDAGQPPEIPDHLREWITSRVAKVLALHDDSTVAQDMATLGVASGLDTSERLARKLRDITGSRLAGSS